MSRVRIALAVSCLACAAASCGASRSPEQATESRAETFAGVLPCADCAGIRHELTLYSERVSGRPVKYELIQTYLGTREGDRTFRSEGRWTILRGTESNRDATVYQLDYDRPTAARSFLKVGNAELRLLDRNQREISSSAPHSLWLLSSPSPMPAVVLTERDSGRSIEIDVGRRLDIVLPANRSTGYAWTLAGASDGVLTRLGEEYAQDSSGGLVGAGGVETWSFEARRAGQSILRLEYRRSRERDAPPASVVSYTISVK